jgi:hypothetical protein
MSPFDFVCPCCTGALLHTLAQTSTHFSRPQLFLELGKGTFVAAIGRGSSSQPKPTRSPSRLTAKAALLADGDQVNHANIITAAELEGS